MHTLNLDHLTDHQTRTLTGCSNAVLLKLKTKMREQYALRPGRPLKHSIEQRLYLTLFKPLTNLPYRAIEAITGIDAVTASRIVKSVVACQAGATLIEQDRPIFLIVDATVTRGGTRQPRYYSGHKHYKGVKMQVVWDQRQIIRHISQPWPASVHDNLDTRAPPHCANEHRVHPGRQSLCRRVCKAGNHQTGEEKRS